jgi:predicted small lipoprotein YifL
MNRRTPPGRARLGVIAAIGACLAVAGCGQKGNLYLPNQKKKVPTTQPAPNTQAQPSAPPGSSSGSQ